MNQHTHAVADTLKKVMADTYALYFKTHSFHWNVEGERFVSLHTLFEEHYNNMWMALDEIAERIRSLEIYAPCNAAELYKITEIKDETEAKNAGEMITTLITDHTTVMSTLKKAVSVAEEAEDHASTDLILGRLSWHEKTVWMLRSLNK